MSEGNSTNRLGRWKETTDYTPTTDEVETAFHEFASQLEQAQPGTYPAPEFSDWIQAMYGFQRWMQKVQYDAWEEGYDKAHKDLANDGFGEIQSPNPYRVRERNNGMYCMAEHCEHRHWRSGGMPTHQRGEHCPTFKEEA